MHHHHCNFFSMRTYFHIIRPSLKPKPKIQVWNYYAMYPYLSVHYDRAMGYAIIPNRNLLSLQELAKMQGISSSSLHVQCARSSTERGCPFVLLISSFTSGCVDSIYEGVY